MSLSHLRWWAASAGIILLALASMALYAGRAFDPFFDGLVPFLLGGLILGLFTLVTGIPALRWKLARRYFLALNLGAVLVLLLAYTCHLYQRGAFRVGFGEAQNYMAVANPALSNYQHSYGHYPDSLRQLSLTLQPPSGMTYVRKFDPRHPLDEFYSVTFSDAIYCPDGTWFIDD